jgi:hypothetical protein
MLYARRRRPLHADFPCPAFYKTILYTACGYIRTVPVFFGNVDEPSIEKTSLNSFLDECFEKTGPMFALDFGVDCEDVQLIHESIVIMLNELSISIPILPITSRASGALSVFAGPELFTAHLG